jgi:hypothetical protein
MRRQPIVNAAASSAGVKRNDGSASSAAKAARRSALAIGLRNARRNARHWLDQLVADRAISLAAREKRSERAIRQTLSLAFLNPGLVEAALEDTCLGASG